MLEGFLIVQYERELLLEKVSVTQISETSEDIGEMMGLKIVNIFQWLEEYVLIALVVGYALSKSRNNRIVKALY